MKNKRFKRETAWLVVGTLMVSTMLAGCGKKNVDYDIDGSNGNKDSGSLQDKYDIPQSYDGSIAVGDSGLNDITVKVSDISVPDTAIMYTEKLSRNDTGQEGRKKAAEAIFDTSKGIYAYDEDNMTKADIEAQIDSWRHIRRIWERMQTISRRQMMRSQSFRINWRKHRILILRQVIILHFVIWERSEIMSLFLHHQMMKIQITVLN